MRVRVIKAFTFQWSGKHIMQVTTAKAPLAFLRRQVFELWKVRLSRCTPLHAQHKILVDGKHGAQYCTFSTSSGQQT